jgi:chromate reductase, NAD(P)H dehydrogenase (quinone)
MGASPGFTGTARAQVQLRQTLAVCQAHVLLSPEVLVGAAHEKFDAAGRLTDTATRTHLASLLRALAELVRRMHRGEVEAA